jgi:hypothetical protein
MTEVTLDQVYAEVKRMQKKLKSLEKKVNTLAGFKLPEEEVNPEEIEELKILKEEALRGECVSLEEVMKKHGAKKRA